MFKRIKISSTQQIECTMSAFNESIPGMQRSRAIIFTMKRKIKKNKYKNGR